MRPALSLIFLILALPSLANVEPKETNSSKNPQGSGSWTATLPVAKFVGEDNSTADKALANGTKAAKAPTKVGAELLQTPGEKVNLTTEAKVKRAISLRHVPVPAVLSNSTALQSLNSKALSLNGSHNGIPQNSSIPRTAKASPVKPTAESPAELSNSPQVTNRSKATAVTATAAPAAPKDSVLVRAGVAASNAVPTPAESAAHLAPHTVHDATEVASPLGPQWHTWHIWKIWPQLGGLEKLLAGITFMSMLKACCMAGNILVQISPYPQVQRWEASGCTGDSDAAPYVSIAFGGWQWCYYGLFAFFVTKRSGFLILVHSNCLGAVLGTYYSVAFYRNCNQSSLGGLQRYTSAVVMLVLFQLCSVAVLPVERALFVTGLISSFCSFIGAISILVSLPRVIRTQDSSSIPALLVSANLLSSLVWCICGWMLEDPLIAAPNVVGFVSGLVCLFLKYMYPDHEWAAKRPRERRQEHVADLTPLTVVDSRTLRSVTWKLGYQSCDTGGTD